MLYLLFRRCCAKPVFTPFNSTTQVRWKKPVDSAQTRLENRTLDSKLDKLMNQHRKLNTILKLHEIMSKRRNAHHVPVEMLTRWRNVVGLNTRVGAFLHRFPLVFRVYTHPVNRSLCVRLTSMMRHLIKEEMRIARDSKPVAIDKLKRLIMLSPHGTLHAHALWLVRRELGLPDDFRNSILGNCPKVFRMVSLEVVGMVCSDETLASAEVEKWREKEYRDKWLSEFETKYAFPIDFPTGFRIERGFREKLRNWQRLQYLKPYDDAEVVRVRSCGGLERYEKRAVALIHELLSLTVEKMIPVERLAHFRKDFSMEVNLRELLLKHPGIFYISTRARVHTVFLREGYSKGCLIQTNPIHKIRRKMLELVKLGRRNPRRSSTSGEFEDGNCHVVPAKVAQIPSDGDWVIPVLEKCKKRQVG